MIDICFPILYDAANPMPENERAVERGDEIVGRSDENTDAGQQLELAVPSLETALQSPAAACVDWHLGRGVVFALGEHRASLELYPQVVRVSVPQGQLDGPPSKRSGGRCPKGSSSRIPITSSCRWDRGGDVLFQSPPAPPPGDRARTAATTGAAANGALPLLERQAAPSQPADVPRSPAPRREKARSERYIGRLGEVKTHTTKPGQARGRGRGDGAGSGAPRCQQTGEVRRLWRESGSVATITNPGKRSRPSAFPMSSNAATRTAGSGWSGSCTWCSCQKSAVTEVVPGPGGDGSCSVSPEPLDASLCSMLRSGCLGKAAGWVPAEGVVSGETTTGVRR